MSPIDQGQAPSSRTRRATTGALVLVLLLLLLVAGGVAFVWRLRVADSEPAGEGEGGGVFSLFSATPAGAPPAEALDATQGAPPLEPGWRETVRVTSNGGQT